MARRGAELEEGADAVAGCGEVATGRRFALNFWDANSTKALHIGHLRNLALGNALGNALDRGRRRGRAAQHHLRHRPQHGRGDGRRRAQRQVPAELRRENGVKSDHFVGYCYADYVKNGASRGARLAQTTPPTR